MREGSVQCAAYMFLRHRRRPKESNLLNHLVRVHRAGALKPGTDDEFSKFGELEADLPHILVLVAPQYQEASTPLEVFLQCRGQRLRTFAVVGAIRDDQ